MPTHGGDNSPDSAWQIRSRTQELSREIADSIERLGPYHTHNKVEDPSDPFHDANTGTGIE
jgi:hypothetical protein